MNIFTSDEVTLADKLEITRHNLSNLLSTYADEADVFTETVQNAFDAVKKAIAENLYKGEKPEIKVIIGRRSNSPHYFYVSDNGVGMEPKIAQQIAIQGFTHGKEKGRTIGYKGIGASYFFATSQMAAMRTVSGSGKKTELTVRGAYSWITDKGEPVPEAEEAFLVPQQVDKISNFGRGTAVYFQFHEAMRPSSLSNIVVKADGHESEIKNWVSYLAGKTAIGSVEDIEQLGIKLTVHLDTDDGLSDPMTWMIGEYSPAYKTIGYPFPHKVFGHKKNIDELARLADGKKPQHANRYRAVHKRWTADEIIEETTKLEARAIEKLREQLLWVEGYLCSSTDVLKDINRTLGGRHQIIRYGIRLASDGTPQGRMVDLSLTSSQGLDRQSHIVIAFKGLELDPGRKICADEDVSKAIPEIGKKVVNILKDYRWVFKKEDRPDITSDLEAWSNEIDERAEDSVVKDLYDASEIARVLCVDPGTEQEVIALFVSLLSNGLLNGYKLRAISGFNRYDSLLSIDTNDPKLKSDVDILSIRSESDRGGENKVLEFKYNFDDLLTDFDDKVKNPSEVDVVVCWKVPSLNVARGRIEPTYGNWNTERQLYGASYLWTDDNDVSSVPIICLRNVVLELLKKNEMDRQEPGVGTAKLRQLETRDHQASV